MDNLGGMVLGAQGRIDEAQPYIKAALAMYRDVLGPDHPDVSISAGNLGKLLFQGHRYEAAEPLLRDSLRIREVTFPAVDRRTASLRIMLANCMLKLNRPAEAEPLMQQLKQREANAGEELPNDLIVALIDFYHQTGNNDEEMRFQAMLKER